jgi:tRNA(Ile)-lysidine synthase
MAPAWETGGINFFRPLLKVSSAAIRTWLQDRSIPFIEDPTNTDTRFLRNRIRHDLLPQLREVFPHIADSVSRSASHAAQAQELLDAMAKEDAQALLCNDSTGLRISSLQVLPRPRQANVLRWWLKSVHGVIPSAAQLEELLDQLQACTTRGHRIHMKVGPGFAQRQGPALHWYNPALLLDKK